MKDELVALGVDVVSAHLPFKGVHTGREYSSEWSRVAEAFGVLGGGFALCIQAALMACDAGTIEAGMRIIAASADTAAILRACRTESFLSPTEGLLAEHIICRPRLYTISKRDHFLVQDEQLQQSPPLDQLTAAPVGLLPPKARPKKKMPRRSKV